LSRTPKPRKESIIMLKLVQNSLRLPALLGSAAAVTLLATATLAPASAQGAPDQLRYLDPPKSATVAATDQHNVRNAYARVHIKKPVAHQ
jgi:hypothetical protein